MFRELERLSDLPKALQSNFLRSNLVPQLEIQPSASNSFSVCVDPDQLCWDLLLFNRCSAVSAPFLAEILQKEFPEAQLCLDVCSLSFGTLWGHQHFVLEETPGSGPAQGLPGPCGSR